MAMTSGELPRAGLESLPWWCGCRRAGGLTNPATTHAQIQGSEVAHPNIYLIFAVLEHMKTNSTDAKLQEPHDTEQQ